MVQYNGARNFSFFGLRRSVFFFSPLPPTTHKTTDDYGWKHNYSNTIKFDSKRIDFEKSNPIVISNEKSNIRYKDKKNNSFESKNTLDTKNKKRYPNYNNKESNHAIVANSKAKRNKSSKKNLFLETDLIATTKKNKRTKN